MLELIRAKSGTRKCFDGERLYQFDYKGDEKWFVWRSGVDQNGNGGWFIDINISVFAPKRTATAKLYEQYKILKNNENK